MPGNIFIKEGLPLLRPPLADFLFYLFKIEKSMRASPKRTKNNPILFLSILNAAFQ